MDSSRCSALIHRPAIGRLFAASGGISTEQPVRPGAPNSDPVTHDGRHHSSRICSAAAEPECHDFASEPSVRSTGNAIDSAADCSAPDDRLQGASRRDPGPGYPNCANAANGPFDSGHSHACFGWGGNTRLSCGTRYTCSTIASRCDASAIDIPGYSHIALDTDRS